MRAFPQPWRQVPVRVFQPSQRAALRVPVFQPWRRVPVRLLARRRHRSQAWQDRRLARHLLSVRPAEPAQVNRVLRQAPALQAPPYSSRRRLLPQAIALLPPHQRPGLKGRGLRPRRH